MVCCSCQAGRSVSLLWVCPHCANSFWTSAHEAVVLWAAMFPHSDMEVCACGCMFLHLCTHARKHACTHARTHAQGSAGYSFYMMLIAVVLCLPATAIVIWNSQQAERHSPSVKPSMPPPTHALPIIHQPSGHMHGMHVCVLKCGHSCTWPCTITLCIVWHGANMSILTSLCPHSGR